jgi:hypothetical protein
MSLLRYTLLDFHLEQDLIKEKQLASRTRGCLLSEDFSTSLKRLASQLQKRFDTHQCFVST